MYKEAVAMIGVGKHCFSNVLLCRAFSSLRTSGLVVIRNLVQPSRDELPIEAFLEGPTVGDDCDLEKPLVS